MNPFNILNIFLLLFAIYLFVISGYILARRKFKCLRCGKCCSLRVDLSEEDIKRIRKAGYKNFFDKKKRLNKVNGYCIFLTLKKGVTSCKLETSAKPEICKKFPLVNGWFGKKYDYRCKSFYNSKK
jgi:Fe-S-cluster containining protein